MPIRHAEVVDRIPAAGVGDGFDWKPFALLGAELVAGFELPGRNPALFLHVERVLRRGRDHLIEC